MPNTASAKKRLRQNEKKRLHNRSVKSAIRTQIRKIREAVAAGEVESAESQTPQISKMLDQAAARRVIHPKKAARLKSRLQKLIKSAKTAA